MIDNTLLFSDFGVGTFDAIGFVAKLYNTSYGQAMGIINKEMQLGFKDTYGQAIPVLNIPRKLEVYNGTITPHTPTIIKIVKRK